MERLGECREGEGEALEVKRQGRPAAPGPHHAGSLGKSCSWPRLGLCRGPQKINQAIIRVIINLFPQWCQAACLSNISLPGDF